MCSCIYDSLSRNSRYASVKKFFSTQVCDGEIWIRRKSPTLHGWWRLNNIKQFNCMEWNKQKQRTTRINKNASVRTGRNGYERTYRFRRSVGRSFAGKSCSSKFEILYLHLAADDVVTGKVTQPTTRLPHLFINTNIPLCGSSAAGGITRNTTATGRISVR